MSERFRRRSPEEMLQEIQRLSRGQHRIYLGAAPGVGKTYAMLNDALTIRDEGIDVVIGCLDTHGREETERARADLEMLPLRASTRKGLEVYELDVAAVVARNPDIVLVDELAHTNADDAKSPKRYLDVEDILDAGISVWSTLNIQHLESLNDTVHEITGVEVRETVPDSVIRQATELRVIDLTPEALIERLKQGKVYPSAVAHNALQNFFRQGNLTALREIVLRAVADDTDSRLETYMHRHDIAGPWRAHDRIMVALTPAPSGARLIRRGYRRAQRMKADLTVVTVSPGPGLITPENANRLEQHRNLARKLGAEVVELYGTHVPRVLLAYANQHHVTEIIFGESHRSRWQEFFRGSVINDILRLSTGIDILVMGEDNPKNGS